MGVAACGGSVPPGPGVSPSVSHPAPPTASGSPDSPAIGVVVPAPGSDGRIFPANPGAIVVFIDAGHGGCLDWGVPNPVDNTIERAEKTMTLEMALALRDRLAEAGVQVVLSRDEDEAVAGDVDAEFGCDGAPFRDANGDGEVGFDPEGFTLLRDELTARIDLANLARADVLVSIHVNSMTENDQVYEIAATQTYFTDETAWGDASARLAELIQREVTDSLGAVASYERQDRGTQAVNYYIIAPPLTEEGGEEHEPRARPRGIQMPGVLAEVGSMSLEAESELLASETGHAAVADGLLEGVTAFLDERAWGVRYDALIEGGGAGTAPRAAPGSGPPFWPPELPVASDGRVEFDLRLTNTGMERWAAGMTLYAGWERTDEPYLVRRPSELFDVPVQVPALGPGESVVLRLELDAPAGEERHVLWISLAGAGEVGVPAGPGDFADRGSPPLQLGTP